MEVYGPYRTSHQAYFNQVDLRTSHYVFSNCPNVQSLFQNDFVCFSDSRGGSSRGGDRYEDRRRDDGGRRDEGGRHHDDRRGSYKVVVTTIVDP